MNWKFWDKPTAAGQPAPAPLTEGQQRTANFLADREQKNRIKSVLIELVEQTRFLTKQDIARWRAAWQQAISVQYPNRVALLAIYRDIEIDGHILAIKGQILNEVLQKVIKIVDAETEENELPDLKKQLQDAQWFIDYCSLVIDAEFNGYNLAQFGDIIEVNGIKKFECVEFVEREYVIPEHHVFVKNMGEHWSNGFDYTQPPFNAWCIGLGKPKNLGLYNALAPHALSKKNMQAFWDKFGEIFGMPIRIGKTSSTNPNDRNNITDMLQKMGSAAWGLFPDGTEIEIKESTRHDAWQIYDKRIDRCNTEMSKAVVNQTMTTDNGSSKSQSETHLTIQQNVIEYFATLVRISVNDKLIPFMIMHGFAGWEKARFKFDDTVEYTPQEQINIETMILQFYDVEPEYFHKKYNVPVIAKKATPAIPFVPTNKSFFD